jgi:hypothetical protein
LSTLRSAPKPVFAESLAPTPTPREESPNRRVRAPRAELPDVELTQLTPAAEPEESLVVDARAGLTPAQMVENKLVSLLCGKGLLASHIQMASLLRKRG